MARQADLSRKNDVRMKCPNSVNRLRTFRTKIKKCQTVSDKCPTTSDIVKNSSVKALNVMSDMSDKNYNKYKNRVISVYIYT